MDYDEHSFEFLVVYVILIIICIKLGLLEGVINFVSLNFFFWKALNHWKYLKIQYLQGLVGSGIRWKSKDTKLYTLPLIDSENL